MKPSEAVEQAEALFNEGISLAAHLGAVLSEIGQDGLKDLLSEKETEDLGFLSAKMGLRMLAAGVNIIGGLPRIRGKEAANELHSVIETLRVSLEIDEVMSQYLRDVLIEWEEEA